MRKLIFCFLISIICFSGTVNISDYDVCCANTEIAPTASPSQVNNKTGKPIYKVPLTKGDHSYMLYASVIINGTIFTDMLVDTGCTGIYLKYSDYEYCIKHNIISEKDFIGYVDTQTFTRTVKKSRRYKVKNFTMGEVSLRNAYITFPPEKTDNRRLLGLSAFKECFSGMYIGFDSNTMFLYV